MILIFSGIFVFLVTNEIKANDERFEKKYFEVGYKEVNEALEESENHFKRDITLPTQEPPITFTHILGRFNNLEGNQNDELEISFLNKDLTQNHYTIRVKPIQHKLTFREEQIDTTLQLNNGEKAIFSTWAPGVNILAFEKDEWQYILTIDKEVSHKVTQEVLLEIANSIR